MARRTTGKKPKLPKSEREKIRREREQRPHRGKRKPKFKTRQIDVVEWLPSGRKKPQRRVWRTFPKEKCPPDVSPVCRYCSVGQPLELSQGRGKKKLTDPSIIEGWAVLGPNRKTAMQVRRTGRGYEYFLARFPSQDQAWEHALKLSYACEEGLALVEGREAARPITETERDWEHRQEVYEEQVKKLIQTLPSEMLQDIGLLPRGITQKEFMHLRRHTKAVMPGGVRTDLPETPKSKKPREVLVAPRKWEPWLGEEEAELIHEEQVNRALQRLREKRRWSARQARKKGIGGYADVFTLSSGPFEWAEG